MNLLLRLLGLICITSLGSGTILGQVPSNDIGGNPHKLKWKQIQTPLAQIVFPEGQEADGRRVADIITYLAEQDNSDIGQLSRVAGCRW